MSLVIRRVGGLEDALGHVDRDRSVIRRVGGLEVPACRTRTGGRVIRRVGGLEGQDRVYFKVY